MPQLDQARRGKADRLQVEAVRDQDEEQEDHQRHVEGADGLLVHQPTDIDYFTRPHLAFSRGLCVVWRRV